MSTFNIPNSKLLAVQEVCGVIVCKQCKIGLPSERSAKDHLVNMHSVDPSQAKQISEKSNNAAQSVQSIPNPLRDIYLHAPEQVPGSDDHTIFLRPLKGIEVSSGYRCTKCNSCYTSEKGIRNHLSLVHSILGTDEWDGIALNGTISLQTIFGGNKTKHFPVSSAVPFGHVLSAPSPSHSHRQFRVSPSLVPPTKTTPSSHLPQTNFSTRQAVQEFFTDMNQALAEEHASQDIPTAHVNPYLAATEFHIQLKEAGFDKDKCTEYSALTDNYTDEENLAVQDVKAYFLRTRTLAKDVSPALLNDINMSGHKEFNVISDASASKYAKNFSRLVVCAFRVRHLPFILGGVRKHIDAYFESLKKGNRDDGSRKSRLDLLHQLVFVLCLSRLSKAESPKKLFIRHFVMFSSLIPNARNQTEHFRWAQAKDITHLLAALLYGASSCALHEIHRLGLRVTNLRTHTSKIETRKQRRIMDERLETILLALHESQNSPAAFVRKLLTTARSISSSEDVSFLFDTCDQHPLCGIVDNVHMSMNAIGQIIRHYQKDIDTSFNALLYGACLPPRFLSQISAMNDSLQDCQPGTSFLSQGKASQCCKTYTMWLFDTITTATPTGKAAFTSNDSDLSSGKAVTLFGKALRRSAIEHWLKTIQDVQDNLLVCTHLSSGSPGRATELETLKLFNDVYSPRNFYISQGRVVVVTRYSKTRSLSGLDKIIPRFPDLVTSKQFLTYLVMFRTLETAFVGALYGNNTMKTHMQALFVERGANYQAPRIRDTIRAAFRKHSIPIEFNHYRHFTAGITPVVIEGSSRLQRENLIQQATAVAHLQAGHSPAVAEHNYARRQTELPSLSSSSLAKYKLFSFEWHRCLGLVDTESKVCRHSFPTSSPKQLPPHIPDSLSNAISSTISKSIEKQFQTFPSLFFTSKYPPYSTPQESMSKRLKTNSILLPHLFPVESHLQAYLPVLRTFIADQNALFRSETQLRSTVAVAKAEHDMLLLMKTGAGKTLSILLPVFLEGADSCTVIFVPLAALVHEIVDRCQKWNISVATWSSRKTHAQVYVISADHTRKDIEGFLRALQNSGRLRRIVFDEAHLLLFWYSFRPSFRRLPYAIQSRANNIQIVLCTATLPPIYRERLLDILCLPSAVLYAHPTIRFNLKYQVLDTSDRSLTHANGRFLTQDEILQQELCKQLLDVCSFLLHGEGGRILIFCLYRNQVEETKELLTTFLNENLPCRVPIRSYHAAMQSNILDDVYAFWKTSDSNIKIVVSTSAFGTGLDVPNVRAVFHLGGSNSLVEYVQETGRAGRDGKKALCVLLYNKSIADRHTNIILQSPADSSYFSEQDEDDKRQEWFLMKQYMMTTNACRKNFIFRHMDGTAPGLCLFNQHSENCDFCDTISIPPITSSSSIGSHLFSPFILPSTLIPRPPLPIDLSLSPASQQGTIVPETQRASSPQTLGSDALQDQTFPNFHNQLSMVPPGTQKTLLPSPLPVARTLNFNSPSTSVQRVEDPLTQYRKAAHSLQNICVPCFVMDRCRKPSNHSCRNMKNRCKRCFHLGHSTKDCKTFNPRRKNFCYGCSLSQVKGENIHKIGEFGSSCYMRVLRDIAWMLWANGLHLDDSFHSDLCTSHDSTRLNQIVLENGELHGFYLSWLNSSSRGVPNIVKLILWWLPRQSSF